MAPFQLHKAEGTASGLLSAHCSLGGPPQRRRSLRENTQVAGQRLQTVGFAVRRYPSGLLSQFEPFRALVWGSSVKHNPQRVGKDHILNDEDVVQVIKKYVFVCQETLTYYFRV